MKSPLHRLTTVTRAVVPEDGHEPSVLRRKWLGLLLISDSDPGLDETRTVARSPCTCQQDGAWICQPCGRALKTADTTYTRGWQWRTSYGTLGGLGAGIGTGNEGVECGRDADCLDAKEVEQEIQCDADDIAALEAEMAKAEIDGHSWRGSSYTTQDFLGIGGQVKKKIKKRVLVGAVVKEYEDERLSKEFCAREQKGLNRSWCS
jgi:hypothetical protein